jgi:hypothetical protein
MNDTVRKLVTSECEKISTPRGDGARSMTPISATYNQPAAAANVNFSYTGADWFGPLPPMHPIAPPEVAGRVWDFIPGYNLQTRPRADAAVDYATLRAIADAYAPLRLVIERRKDQMSRLPWTIRVRHEGRGRRPKAAQLSAATRSLLKEVESFFSRPSYDWNFRDWLRTLTEDLLVTDAPALYCERNSTGELMGLRPLDGTTIKRVIDSHGGMPREFDWSGSPFDWCSRTITRENYVAEGFKLFRGAMLYPPAYQQVLKGLPAVNYTAMDLLYRPLNRRAHHVYGFSPVEQVISTVNIAMRRTQSQLDYFREGNMPEGIYGLPETWSPDQVARFQDYWDNLHVGNLGVRRRMKFLSGAGKYQALKEPPLKAEVDEWLIRIICFAFSYPPSAFVELSNRSIAEQHERTAEREGLEPLKAWASDLINEVIADEFDGADGTIEFAWVEEDEIDPSTQAKILSQLVAGGILTANEARERLGEEPSASPAANELMIRTTTGDAPIDAAKPIQQGE